MGLLLRLLLAVAATGLVLWLAPHGRLTSARRGLALADGPRVWRGGRRAEVEREGVKSLADMARRFGRVRSDVEAKGMSRARDGELVVDHPEWDGLRAESLADAVAYVTARRDEDQTPFGSLRAFFFAGENDLSRAMRVREALGEFPGEGEGLGGLPAARLAPLDGYTLWMRAMAKPSRFNPVDWHAHPDAGVYVQLLGVKTFVYVDTESWRRELRNVTWDSHFPLVFAQDGEIRALQRAGRLAVGEIQLRPGDVLYQPPWFMHLLTYDEAPAEFASLRFGFLPLLEAVVAEPGLFLSSIPAYLDVGVKVAAQWLFSPARSVGAVASMVTGH